MSRIRKITPTVTAAQPQAVNLRDPGPNADKATRKAYRTVKSVLGEKGVRRLMQTPGATPVDLRVYRKDVEMEGPDRMILRASTPEDEVRIFGILGKAKGKPKRPVVRNVLKAFTRFNRQHEAEKQKVHESLRELVDGLQQRLMQSKLFLPLLALIGVIAGLFQTTQKPEESPQSQTGGQA